MDALFLGLIFMFFIATAALVSFCDSLREDRK